MNKSLSIIKKFFKKNNNHNSNNKIVNTFGLNSQSNNGLSLAPTITKTAFILDVSRFF